MLLLDKEKKDVVKLDEKFAKKYASLIATKNFIFKINKSYITVGAVKDRSGGVRNLVPRSISHEPFFFFTDKNGTRKELRYASMQRPKQVGNEIIQEYMPDEIVFDNGELMVRNDIDLLYFLMKHPLCENEGNEFRDKYKQHEFYYEDNATMAKIRMQERETLQRSYERIFSGYATSYTETQLKELSKSYGISDVEDMNIDEIRDVLYTIAEKNPVGFTEKAGGKDFNIEVLVSDCIHYNVICNDNKTKAWYYYDSETKGLTDKICDILGNEDAKQKLVRFLSELDVDRHQDRLRELVKRYNMPVTK